MAFGKILYRSYCMGHNEKVYACVLVYVHFYPLFHNGSPLGSQGPLGDLFGDLGPLFMFWVPFFSILD